LRVPSSRILRADPEEGSGISPGRMRELEAEELQESLTAESGSRAGALTEAGSLGYLPMRIAQYGFLFVSALVVTRALGPVGRAQYALPLALAGAVWVLTNLTLEIAAGRLLARREAKLQQLLPTLSLSFISLSLLAVAISVIVGLTVRSVLLAGASETMVLLAALTIPFLLASQLAGQLLIVLGRLRAQGLATAFGALPQLAMVAALALMGQLTPERALGAALLGFASTGILLVVMLARDVGARALLPAFKPAVLRRLVRVGAVLHPGSIAIQFAPRLDLILVAAFLSAHDVGIYSLALVLADSMLLASQALSISAVHRQFADDERDAARFTVDFIRQSLLLTIAVIIAVAPFAYPLILLLYGSAFAASAVPFVILLTATAATAIEAPCRILLVRIASPFLISGLVCVSLVVNAALTIVLIQFLSIVGAALASVAAFWGLALAMLWAVRTESGNSVRAVFALPTREDEVVRLWRSTIARVRLALGSAR
jgi:O-antigen/teichoic acid export membrane protein